MNNTFIRIPMKLLIWLLFITFHPSKNQQNFIKQLKTEITGKDHKKAKKKKKKKKRDKNTS